MAVPRGAVSVLQAGGVRDHQLFFDRMQPRGARTAPGPPPARAPRPAAQAAAARAGRPAGPLGPAAAVRRMPPRLSPGSTGTGAEPGQPVAGLGAAPGPAPPARPAAGARVRYVGPPGAGHAAGRPRRGRAVRVLRAHSRCSSARASAPGAPPRSSARWACWTTTGRPPSRAGWTRKLDGLAPGIRADAGPGCGHARRRPAQPGPRDTTPSGAYLNQPSAPPCWPGPAATATCARSPATTSLAVLAACTASARHTPGRAAVPVRLRKKHRRDLPQPGRRGIQVGQHDLRHHPAADRHGG